ncbi:MAG: hypothetical protein K9G76_01320 [Bacteroidales bacterium]|nr:hypothetical protein [Bacteroidales bacterium]MCF8403192.1 hypothetical protein [Bacteroidales bacterium]
MKLNIKPFILLVGILLIFVIPVLADAPPDPGGDPTGGNPVGGGSPIGGGLLTFIIASIYYTFYKIKRDRN